MLPPAPARFSTTTGWPSSGDSFSPSMRAVMSSAPPAAIGTTRRTGRFGAHVGAEPWARAAAGTRAAARPNSGRRRIMVGEAPAVRPHVRAAGPRVNRKGTRRAAARGKPMPNDAPPMAALIEGRLDRLGLTPEEACRQAGLPADFLDRLAEGRAP